MSAQPVITPPSASTDRAVLGALAPSVIFRWRGLEPYTQSFDAMRAFTETRTSETADEIWLVEHPPVFTLGLAGDPAHLLNPNSDIPLVKVDRGGQITYHGPGQVVVYLLLDLRRHGLSVRPLVRLMENAVIDLLAEYGVTACGRVDAPGVYAGNAKVAALGLRIRN